MGSDAVAILVAEDMRRIFAPLAERPMPIIVPEAMSQRGPRRSLGFLLMLGTLAASTAVWVGYRLGSVPVVSAPSLSATGPIVAPVMASRRLASTNEPSQASPSQPNRVIAASESRSELLISPEAKYSLVNDRLPTLAGSSVAHGQPAIARKLTSAPSIQSSASVAETKSPREQGSEPRLPEREEPTDNFRPVGAHPTGVRCQTDSLEDACIYGDVMAADARLRRAYKLAADDGVSPAWLASISRRWDRIRADSLDEPDHAIERYGDLADALDNERRKIK